MAGSLISRYSQELKAGWGRGWHHRKPQAPRTGPQGGFLQTSSAFSLLKGLHTSLVTITGPRHLPTAPTILYHKRTELGFEPQVSDSRALMISRLPGCSPGAQSGSHLSQVPFRPWRGVFSESDLMTELYHLPDNYLLLLRVSYMNTTLARPHSVSPPQEVLPLSQVGSGAGCPPGTRWARAIPPRPGVTEGRAGSDSCWSTGPGSPQHV